MYDDPRITSKKELRSHAAGLSSSGPPSPTKISMLTVMQISCLYESVMPPDGCEEVSKLSYSSWVVGIWLLLLLLWYGATTTLRRTQGWRSAEAEGSTNMSGIPRICSLSLAKPSTLEALDSLNRVRLSTRSCCDPYSTSKTLTPPYDCCWMLRGWMDTKCSAGPRARGPPLLLRRATSASPDVTSRNLSSTRVCVHSSEYHTNQVSVGAERTPFPWALGMQYLRTAMVLLDGRPAMAMQVSMFFGFALADVVEEGDDGDGATSWLSPPQMGLSVKRVFIYTHTHAHTWAQERRQ